MVIGNAGWLDACSQRRKWVLLYMNKEKTRSSNQCDISNPAIAEIPLQLMHSGVPCRNLLSVRWGATKREGALTHLSIMSKKWMLKWEKSKGYRMQCDKAGRALFSSAASVHFHEVMQCVQVRWLASLPFPAIFKTFFTRNKISHRLFL